MIIKNYSVILLTLTKPNFILLIKKTNKQIINIRDKVKGVGKLRLKDIDENNKE